MIFSLAEIADQSWALGSTFRAHEKVQRAMGRDHLIVFRSVAQWIPPTCCNFLFLLACNL